MAQTGYTPILIYSSSTVSQTPTAGNLTNSTLGSELAINITDGKLFYKDNANAVQVIAWKTTPTTAGGTGLTSYTAGDLLYYASGTALSKLAIGASGNYLSSSGTAPQWNAPAALTKTDDTNVTLTLGGSASTALLNAASLTLGWTGQLSVARGGTGNTTGAATAVTSNSTTGLMQITGPAASTTRVMTIPNANFTAARTDAAQSFTGDQTLSTGNLVISTANKGVIGDGGVFLQKYDVIASAGTLDLTIDTNGYGFAGILSVSATRFNFNPQSTRTVFAITAYGTTMTNTSLQTQNGASGSSAFSITCPSAGVVRITDTSGNGSQVAVYVTFSGALNFAFA